MSLRIPQVHRTASALSVGVLLLNVAVVGVFVTGDVALFLGGVFILFVLLGGLAWYVLTR